MARWILDFHVTAAKELADAVERYSELRLPHKDFGAHKQATGLLEKSAV